jgi:hypothetical protein
VNRPDNVPRFHFAKFATYLPEKTTTLARWAEHLMAVVTGQVGNVVPLRAMTG